MTLLLFIAFICLITFDYGFRNGADQNFRDLLGCIMLLSVIFSFNFFAMTPNSQFAAAFVAEL